MFNVQNALRAAKLAVQHKLGKEIGSGQFSTVYETTPGLVAKVIESEKKNNVINEINMQQKAATLGAAPQINTVDIKGLEAFGKRFPIEPGPNPEVKAEIVMQDLRNNYKPASTTFLKDYETRVLTNKQNLDQAKQMSLLALNNIALSDRHPGNIMFNRTTGRPIQLDFGLSEAITSNTQKAANLSLAVTQGLKAAGLMDEATILQGVVADLLQKDPEMALDVAKQGLSRLQKIKTPVNPQEYVYIDTGNDVPF
jgi:hypothetical protein